MALINFIFKKNSLSATRLKRCLKAGNYETGDSVQENYLSGSDREAIYHNDLSENDLLAERIGFLAKIIDFIKDDAMGNSVQDDLSENDSLTQRIGFLAKIIDFIKDDAMGNSVQDDLSENDSLTQRIGFLAKIIDFIKDDAMGNSVQENWSDNDLSGNDLLAERIGFLSKIIDFIKAGNEYDVIYDFNDLLDENYIDAFFAFQYNVDSTVGKKKSEAFSAFMQEINDAGGQFYHKIRKGPKDVKDVFFKLFKEKLFNISKKIKESAELSALEKQSLLGFKNNLYNFHRKQLNVIINRIIYS